MLFHSIVRVGNGPIGHTRNTWRHVNDTIRIRLCVSNNKEKKCINCNWKQILLDFIISNARKLQNVSPLLYFIKFNFYFIHFFEYILCLKNIYSCVEFFVLISKGLNSLTEVEQFFSNMASYKTETGTNLFCRASTSSHTTIYG